MNLLAAPRKSDVTAPQVGTPGELRRDPLGSVLLDAFEL